MEEGEGARGGQGSYCPGPHCEVPAVNVTFQDYKSMGRRKQVGDNFGPCYI